MRKRGFCEFYKDLYWGASVNNKALVKWKLKHGAGQLSIFCVTRALNANDQLDIVHCAVLTQKHYRNNPVHVYGLTEGYSQALDMIVTISARASECGMDGDLLGYLQTMGAQEENN